MPTLFAVHVSGKQRRRRDGTRSCCYCLLIFSSSTWRILRSHRRIKVIWYIICSKHFKMVSPVPSKPLVRWFIHLGRLLRKMTQLFFSANTFQHLYYSISLSFALHKQKGDALSFPPDHAILPKPIKTWTLVPSSPATGTHFSSSVMLCHNDNGNW